MHQLVYDLRLNELQIILDSIKQNKVGSKQSLRKRVLNILSLSSAKAKTLKQKIVQVYKARTEQNNQSQQSQILPAQSLHPSSHQSQPFLRYLRHSPSYNLPFPNHHLQSYNETPSNLDQQFENLPFFKMMQTLLIPMHCQSSIEMSNFTGLFYLTDSIRHSIVKSWNISKQEYKIQIILRLVQIGLKENVTERLPYNIAVSVNDRPCKLPILNIPTKAGITPWRCNVPIDITQQTDLRNCIQNTLKITWVEEPHDYTAAVFVAQKLTWSELLVELKKKPFRANDKTKELIKKLMKTDADMGVDSMFATVKDPLSKTRMELPARGKDCIHLQCFDAIQFLQMNEQKQTWICPLCKKKVAFENIEVDEFFLNILQSPNLSEDCENVILLEDGSWTEKKPVENTSYSNDTHSNNQIEVFTLSDSDDDEHIQQKAKRLKCNVPKIENPVIKSEHILDINDLTKTSDTISTENDLVLDLSLKNSTSPPASTSSDYHPVNMLNNVSGLPPMVESSHHMLSSYYLPNITITESNNIDCKPSTSGSSRSYSKSNRHQEKEKPRSVLCVITLD